MQDKKPESAAPNNKPQETPNKPAAEESPVGNPPKNELISGTIQETKEQSLTFAKQINSYFPHPFVAALFSIAVFLLLGKIADWLITGVFSKLAIKTRSSLDNQILALLHRPIFLSVLLLGLGFVTLQLELSANVTSITVKVLQTVAIFLWFRFALRSAIGDLE